MVLKETYAKGVYAWIGIGGLFIFLPRKCSKWRFSLALITVICGIVGMTCYSLVKATTEGGTLGTIITRFLLWSAAIDVIKADDFIKMFGNGFHAMIGASAMSADVEYSNAHNGILNQIIYYGIPSLIIYLAIYIKSLRKIVNCLHASTGSYRVICLFLCSILIALFGEYFFEPANDGVTLQSHLFLFYALIQVMSKQILTNCSREITPTTSSLA
jgi:O-antigen ligase